MKLLLNLLFFLFIQNSAASEAELLTILKAKTDSGSIQAAIKAGNERALLCKYCHGEDGNSKKNTIPNLASQNVVYLIRQFELFTTKKRNNKTMNELSKILTPEDKVNIALFYATQKVKPQQPYKPELASRGKTLFETQCFFCHGKNAHGKVDTPYIAGQPSEYILRTLSSYTSNIVKRAETPMSRVARTLKPDDIEALTAYLTSLK